MPWWHCVMGRYGAISSSAGGDSGGIEDMAGGNGEVRGAWVSPAVAAKAVVKRGRVAKARCRPADGAGALAEGDEQMKRGPGGEERRFNRMYQRRKAGS